MDAIIEDRLFISTITIAQSSSRLAKYGITHILTVCPNFASTGDCHKVIVVDDTEFENLLIRLPEACDFIHSVLEASPAHRILVHCVLGISRSVSVVAAYLMKTRQWTPDVALEFIRSRRPQARPNSGFRKQLEVFMECGYQPSPSQTPYRRWLSNRRESLTDFMQEILSSITVVENQLYYATKICESPEDFGTFTTLLTEFRICHFLSVAPSHATGLSELPADWFFHVDVPSNILTTTILATTCAYIQAATEESSDLTGRAIVYSSSEERACVICCAYLIAIHNMSPFAAMSLSPFTHVYFSQESVKVLLEWSSMQR